MNPAEQHSTLNTDYVQLERSLSSDDTEFLTLPNIPSRTDFANQIQQYTLCQQRQQQQPQQQQPPQQQNNEQYFYSRMSPNIVEQSAYKSYRKTQTPSPSASASSIPTTLSSSSPTHIEACAVAALSVNDNVANRYDANTHNQMRQLAQNEHSQQQHLQYNYNNRSISYEIKVGLREWL